MHKISEYEKKIQLIQNELMPGISKNIRGKIRKKLKDPCLHDKAKSTLNLLEENEFDVLQKLLYYSPLDREATDIQSWLTDLVGPLGWKDEEKEVYTSVFDFSAINSDNQYRISTILDVQVCPYCNINPTFIHSKGAGKKYGRPELDHFFPKSVYPFLACSVGNLVPCCSYCNKVKKEFDPATNKIHNPCIEQVGDSFVFFPKVSEISGFYGKTDALEYGIRITATGEEKEKTEQFLKLFNIQEIYSKYHKSVLASVLTKSIHGGNKFIVTYRELFQDVIKDESSLLSLMHAHRIETYENWNSLPFSKLLTDLTRQIQGNIAHQL